MILCHRHRFILFCNPGTGTGPVLRLLAPWADETLTEYRDLSPERPFHHLMSPAQMAAVFAARGWEFDDYRRITLVMNPFTRLQGLYRRVADTDPLWRQMRSAGLGQPAFGPWLRSTRPEGPGAGGRPWELWRRFGTWTAAAWGDGLVTDWIRAETMAQDLPPLFAALGIDPGPVPPPIPDPGQAWATVYDGPTAQLVARRYASDLARFCYHHPVLDWVS